MHRAARRGGGRRGDRGGHANRRRGLRGLPAVLASSTPDARAAHRGAAARPRCRSSIVSLSSEVQPEFREYERFSTTVLNAYLQPVMARYLAQLADGARGAAAAGRGRHQPVERRADVARPRAPVPDPHRAFRARPPARSARSRSRPRPACPNVITLDMGGTSADVALIRGGARGGRLRPAGRRTSRSGCRWSTSTPSAPAAARSPGSTATACSRSGR